MSLRGAGGDVAIFSKLVNNPWFLRFEIASSRHAGLAMTALFNG